jgi:protein SCO1/2
MDRTTPRWSRRHWLGAVAALAGGPRPAAAAAHGLLGLVTPPQPLPDFGLTLHDGRRTGLAALLRGRVTALQLMFTGCSSVCPLQGAVFAAVQERLAAGDGRAASVPLQLLSISIDALGDDARALAAWRQRHGAGPGWLAGVPAMADVDRLVDLLRGRVSTADRHTAQVFVIDRLGRLAYRCAELAPAPDVVQALLGISRQRA